MTARAAATESSAAARPPATTTTPARKRAGDDNDGGTTMAGGRTGSSNGGNATPPAAGPKQYKVILLCSSIGFVSRDNYAPQAFSFSPVLFGSRLGILWCLQKFIQRGRYISPPAVDSVPQHFIIKNTGTETGAAARGLEASSQCYRGHLPQHGGGEGEEGHLEESDTTPGVRSCLPPATPCHTQGCQSSRMPAVAALWSLVQTGGAPSDGVGMLRGAAVSCIAGSVCASSGCSVSSGTRLRHCLVQHLAFLKCPSGCFWGEPTSNSLLPLWVLSSHRCLELVCL
ncbi:uncharacterized protein LOC133384209 [Rhineura floridana]|uniref:uncharacterized protein LOC133384209 n=1 Tax=Rhineura floridana TaxID=261503 RepID=UPI002AC815FA|nr:uncharacterized protein LOC133384209 [Rhineura floridana]